jgi:hypothetical protein
MEQHLQALVSQWEQRARRKLADAEREGDSAGRRLIEHGAMCYANAAVELTAAMHPSEDPQTVQRENVELRAHVRILQADLKATRDVLRLAQDGKPMVWAPGRAPTPEGCRRWRYIKTIDCRGLDGLSHDAELEAIAPEDRAIYRLAHGLSAAENQDVLAVGASHV